MARTKNKLNEKVWVVIDFDTYEIYSIHKTELSALRKLNEMKDSYHIKVMEYELEE